MKKKQVNLSKRLKLHKRTVQTAELASKQSRSVSHVDRHCEQGVPITCGLHKGEITFRNKAYLSLQSPAKSSEIVSLERNELDEPSDESNHSSLGVAVNFEDCDSAKQDKAESSFSREQLTAYCDHKGGKGKCKNKSTPQAPFHCNPHMSLLNTFYVFGSIALINVPLQLVGVILWLFENCNSSVNCFGVATQAFKDVAFMAIIVFGMSFFTTYYSAVFVEVPKFSYPFGTLVVASIYMVIGKFVSPIGEILGNHINEPGFLYRLNGTFGDFLVWHEKILTPFYAECGIIAAGVMWQIWTSVYPRSCLNISTTLPPPRSISITHPISSFRKLDEIHIFATFPGKCVKLLRDTYFARQSIYRQNLSTINTPSNHDLFTPLCSLFWTESIHPPQ